MKTYDLVIIGSGTGAQAASSRMRAAGWSVALVDHRPFGGTCALRGCDPKRVLMSGGEAIDAQTRMRGHGVTGDARIDWRDLMMFKRSFTDAVPRNLEKDFAENGIDAFHGVARFTGQDVIVSEGQEFKARYILIATGARPMPLDIPGQEHAVTSEEFLELERLPARLVLVGGGYIAAEFSHLAARAGVHVTVLQRAERMLPAFDPDLVDWLMEKFGGVATESGRVKLNEFLQSVSNPKVYAAGDAASSGPPLTPVSGHDGNVVAQNLLDGNRHRPDYRGVPSVAFTIPPIAAVGLSEAGARAKGLKFRTHSENASDWYTARRLNESVYGFKTLVEEDTDRILGAHLVGPHAEEVINLFGLAIRHGLTTKDLKTTIFAYPTGASDIGYML